jgi:Domain of unknown function (DUF1905)
VARFTFEGACESHRLHAFVEFDFKGRVVEWRGPAPYFFLPLDDETNDAVTELATIHSYGWGCIPVTSTIGATTFITSLMPHDALYLLPLKIAVRRAEGIDVAMQIAAHIEL